MRTANPALSEKIFQNLAVTEEKMTIQGTVNKSFILVAFLTFAAFYSWQSAYPTGWAIDSPPVLAQWYLPVILIAFGLSIIIIFKKTWAPLLAPIYAILEGLALGALSAIFEHRYPGIVMQAVLCTSGTFIALLLAYQSRLIKATENFKLGIVAATGGIALVYLIDLALGFFGHKVPYIHENGMLGIGVSLFVTVVAALNLVLDFDFIEKGAEKGAPKYMEWYAAFGLVITLVWLYLEILRLLGKTRSK